MLRNFILYSLRALRKQKTYVAINVLGLSIGLACSLIIALFIRYELSFDQYNEKKDRIFRVILNGKIGGQELSVTSTASPIGPTMREEFPEVENFLRMNGWGETVLRFGENRFTEDAFIEADSSFFDFFSIPLIRGNKETVLNEPHTLVLSRSNATRIFGDEDPINKMIRVGNDSTLYRITGVMEDIPPETHFDADAIGSFMTNPRANDDYWLSNSFDTYVLLHPNVDPAVVDERFAGGQDRGGQVLHLTFNDGKARDRSSCGNHGQIEGTQPEIVEGPHGDALVLRQPKNLVVSKQGKGKSSVVYLWARDIPIMERRSAHSRRCMR